MKFKSFDKWIKTQETRNWGAEYYSAVYRGFNASQELIDPIVIELNKKIKELTKEIERYRSNSIMSRMAIQSRYNEGFAAGNANSIYVLRETDRLKQVYLDENERLTNTLLDTEDRLDIASKELSGLKNFVKATYGYWLTTDDIDDFYYAGKELLSLVGSFDENDNFALNGGDK